MDSTTSATGSTGASNYRNKYSVYKPNKSGNGGAIQFDFNKEKQSIFLEAAKQMPVPTGSTAPHAFDWGNKIVFKMAVIDIGKVLCVLEGKLKETNLFHDPGKGQYSLSAEVKNNAVSLSKGDYGYYLKVSSQGRDGSVTAVQVTLTEDEAVVLRVLLAKAIEASYGW